MKRFSHLCCASSSTIKLPAAAALRNEHHNNHYHCRHARFQSPISTSHSSVLIGRCCAPSSVCCCFCCDSAKLLLLWLLSAGSSMTAKAKTSLTLSNDDSLRPGTLLEVRWMDSVCRIGRGWWVRRGGRSNAMTYCDLWTNDCCRRRHRRAAVVVAIVVVILVWLWLLLPSLWCFWASWCDRIELELVCIGGMGVRCTNVFFEVLYPLLEASISKSVYFFFS